MSHGESISFEKMDGGGPELSRMIQEFEVSDNPTEENDHHEQKSGTKSAFCKEVLNTLSSFQELCSPVLEGVGNLVATHTREIVDDTVVLASTRIPSDWKGFAGVDGNKDNLFKLIANKVCI